VLGIAFTLWMGWVFAVPVLEHFGGLGFGLAWLNNSYVGAGAVSLVLGFCLPQWFPKRT